MKKLTVLALLSAAALFFSCSQPSSSGSTNNNTDNSTSTSSAGTTSTNGTGTTGTSGTGTTGTSGSGSTGTSGGGSTGSTTNNGLISSFTAPTLPEGGSKEPFAGKTFGRSYDNRAVFGNDGTYTLFGKRERRVNGQIQYKITQQKFKYTFKDNIMYMILISYNDIISDSNDMMTYQDMFNYFNTLPYETYAAEVQNATPAQFKTILQQALEINTNQYFAPTHMSKYTMDENGTFRAYVYYSENDSITTSQIPFKYTLNSITSTELIGNKTGSSTKGKLPVIGTSGVKVLPIDSITDTTITAKDSGITYTFSWRKTWNDGVITLLYSGADSVTQTAFGNQEYTINSKIEDEIPELHLTNP